MVARVQDLEFLDAFLAQPFSQHFRFFDRGRAHQDRLALLAGRLDLFDDRLILLVRGPVDLVILVDTRNGQVCRDFRNAEPVDVAELLGFRRSGAGHARQLLVHAEVVLEGDRGQRLVLGVDRDLLLGLQGLVQALREAAPRHHAAGELVDDDDLAIAHDVVLVALEQAVGLQRVVEMMDDGHVLDVVERFTLQETGLAQRVFHLLRAFLGEGRGTLLLVDLVVGRLQRGDEGVDPVIELGTVLQRAGNDQRRARFVDQDGVDLVDDGVGMASLHHLGALVLHVVAKIVEAEFVVRRVGHVTGIGCLAFLVRQSVDDDARCEAEEAVELAHPFGVAPRQIVVDGNDMHALARQRVEIDRKRGDQCLALARLHLRNAALVQHHATDELHVERPQAERAARGLSYRRKCGNQQLVERCTFLDLPAEKVGARPQLLIR